MWTYQTRLIHDSLIQCNNITICICFDIALAPEAILYISKRCFHFLKPSDDISVTSLEGFEPVIDEVEYVGVAVVIVSHAVVILYIFCQRNLMCNIKLIITERTSIYFHMHNTQDLLCSSAML